MTSEHENEVVNAMDAVYFSLRKRCSADQAEEGRQHALLRVLQRIEAGDEIPNISWMVTVGWNHVREHYRCQVIQAKHKEAIFRANERNSVDPMAELMASEMTQLIEEGIASLPENLRDALMRRLKGETAEQIALHYGVTATAIRARIRNAVERLQGMLQTERTHHHA